MNISRVPLLALAAVALAGCGAATASGGTTPSSSTSATSPSASPTKAAAPVACTLPQLKAIVAGGGAGAGHDYGFVLVTNRSGYPCLLRGYANLAYVSNKGVQVGAAARWDTSAASSTVTLRPGQTAAAPFDSANALNYPAGTCKPEVVPGIRFGLQPRAAGEKPATVTLPFPTEACANNAVVTLSVRPFTTTYQTVSAHP